VSDINAKAEAAAREIAQSRIKKLKEVLELSDAFGEFLLRDEQLAEHAAIITRHVAPLVEAMEAVNDVHGAPCRYDHHGLCQTHSLRSVERDGKWVPECEMELVRKALAAWTAAKDATP
jgi:hypothetical protein